MTRIEPDHRRQLHEDGYVLLRGAFDEQRISTLRAGVESMIRRAQAGDCEVRWIADGVVDRTSHMMHPDKYEAAWGEWVAEDLTQDMEQLLEAPVRHSLFGMLASGAGKDYRMAWHRDLGKPGADDEEAFMQRLDGLSLQFNAPVADVDTFLHVVPASHRRASTQAEIDAAQAGLDGDMPGGVEIRLEPGDILYYNANLWHRGWNPEGRLRWTMHAAYWKAQYPVMTHEQGQRDLLLAPGHLERLPGQARVLVERYVSADDGDPKDVRELKG